MIKGQECTHRPLTAQSKYHRAIELYDEIPYTFDQKKQQEEKQEAVCRFFDAAALGHPKAPFMLYDCFVNNIGIKKNEFIMNLWYGVAFKLGDERCQKDEFIVPELMTKAIDHLTSVIKQIHENIPLYSVVTSNQLNENLSTINGIIKLFSKEISMMDLFDYQPDYGAYYTPYFFANSTIDALDAAPSCGEVEHTYNINVSCCVLL